MICLITLRKNTKGDKYKKFFSYFTKTWLGNKIPNTLWNFNDLLSNPNNITLFHLTNNITENINRYLNRKLKKVICSICSNYLFRESILDIINQFKIKTNNSTYNNKKSEILDFYIKRVGEDNINPLTSPGEVVSVFTSLYLSAGAPALGEAKGLIIILKKIILYVMII